MYINFLNDRKALGYECLADTLYVNLSNKSTYISSTKVLVKKPEGRYIVDVSDTEAQIVGISSRTKKKSMGKFMNLMNKLYDLNLEGY